MFGGKASCLVVFQIVYYYYYYYHKKEVFQFGRQDFSPFVFVIPAVFNVLGTSTMYFGLSLTFASSYQMLRGAVIIFTALLSVAVFGSKLQVYHWVGMLTVVTGSALVSLGDLLNTSYDLNQNGLFTGDLLVVIGQIAVALQLITEQRYVQGYNIPPLQAVGWEGVFGFGIVGIALVPMYFIPWHLPSESYFWQDHTRYEDVIDAVNQIVYIPTLIVAFVCATVSSGFYNFAGMSVTKEVNATTRTVLDSVSALFIWMFGLVFMWQQFNFYQLIGFLVLLVGICIYYNVLLSWVMKKLKIWPSFCGVPDGEEMIQV